jgi:chaperonin GroES
MLDIETRITIDDEVIRSPNLCGRFNDRDLDNIGNWVFENFDRDKRSRVDWEERCKSALNLAMQVQDSKTFPWANCSNIKFPLVTIAAMQFAARAYPAIVNGRSVVQARVIGETTPIATALANRISQHMSWQLLEQDENWEEGTDRALLSQAIVGVAFKKTYYSASQGHPVSEFVFAQDLVFDYWAKSIETCAVKTHIINKYRNDVREMMLRGIYRDCTDQQWYCGTPADNRKSPDVDNRSGLRAPQADHDTPFKLLEQHCWLDLDGDGYAEPYIVTIEEASRCVVRIATRFDRPEDVERADDGTIIKINAVEYFTKLPFIPAPDGSIMDVGFGVLLGPLNESVNSAINQLFDAGTLANTAGGFLGRGAKLKGGVYQFQPFGWQRVDATGDDIRKNIMPLPVREPSSVMFNLLGLLIDYTNRIAGSTDMLAGENPGQNTPAETARTMVEQGQKIYSAIFKRVWRAMKLEFKKLYRINAITLPARMPFGDGKFIMREDYAIGAASVVPVADPTIASEGARFAQAQMIKAAAGTTAGYDRDAVERRYLKALGVDDVAELFPGAAGQEPPKDPRVQIQELKNQATQMELQMQQQMFAMEMQETVRVNSAKILEMEAQVQLLMTKASTETDKQRVSAFRAAIEAMRERNNQMNTSLDRMMENLSEPGINAGAGAVPSMAFPPSDQAIPGMGQV